MSVELEWELYDIFDSGMFAFPIYDHSSARKIVRYLIMRGILHEEIAEAVEESTGDLLTWLNRNGKHKVGEWVIAWINDCREDFDRGELHKMGEEGDADDDGADDRRRFDADFFLPDSDGDDDSGHSDVDDDDDDVGGGGGRRGDVEKRSDSRITELESISSQAPTSSRSSAEALDKSTCKPTPAAAAVDADADGHELQRRRDIYELGQVAPVVQKASRPDDLDLTTCNSSEAPYEPPDSGHFSDLYTTIPSDCCSEPGPPPSSNQLSDDCAAVDLLRTADGRCKRHGGGSETGRRERHAGLASKCTCSVAHYSYTRQKRPDRLGSALPELADADESFYDFFFFDEALSTSTSTYAWTLDLASSLDVDGPGFVLIMTDSLIDCLPWSSEHRYRISSSSSTSTADRRRRLLESGARSVNIDLIWQVKVTQHIKAVREIQTQLNDYNLHSNWYKCSLSLIMDTVSKVVKHYK